MTYQTKLRALLTSFLIVAFMALAPLAHAMKYADRVFETSTTQGTGTYNLAGAVTGFRGFVAGVGTAQKVPYIADDGTNWEIGVGTVTDAATDTLARTTIIASSNSNAAVNWGPGTRNVRLAPVADIVLQRDENKNYVGHYAGTGGGSANVQTATLTPAPSAYSTGMLVSYKPGFANTGAFTLNLNSLGAKSVKLSSGSDPSANAVLTTGNYLLDYDGTNLVLLNPEISVTNIANSQLAAMAANTVKANATAGSATPTDVALTTSTFLCKGSTGNIAACAPGTGLSFSGATLNATGITPTGGVVNTITYSDATNASLTTALPIDDTIPQIAEGGSYMLQSYTMASTTNKLRIEFNGALSGTAAQTACALFVAGGTNAVAAALAVPGSSVIAAPISLTYEFTPATVAAQNYEIRCGNNGGSAVRFNGSTTARLMGGVSISTLKFTEIKN